MKLSRVVRRLRYHIDPRAQPDYPLRVRIYLAVHWLVGSIIIIFLSPPLPNILAFSGILFGTIGAGILYWETVLGEAEIATEVARISRQTDDLPNWDKVAIAFNTFVGGFLFIAFIWQIYEKYYDFTATRLALNVTIATLVSLAPPIATYGALKAVLLSKIKYKRQLNARSDFDGRADHISRSYRLAGLIFVVVGAWAQIPLILTSNTNQLMK